MNDKFFKIKFIVATAFFVTLFCASYAAKEKLDFITKINDIKEFKKFIKTHKNVLVILSKTEKDFKEGHLLNQVAEEIRGSGSVVNVDCGNAKKLCKKLKTNPKSVEYKHFKDGEFFKVYDRLMTPKSMVKFMLNPAGDIPWEEDADAGDVTHFEKTSELKKFLAKEQKPTLVMFYAPWCGYCKKLKPDYSAAASLLKQEAVLAGMDVDTKLGGSAKTEYNITAYPTIILFKKGAVEFNFGGEHTTNGIVSWMRNPQAPKPQEAEKEWSETPSDVMHLTDDNFHDVIQHGQPTLVMFYAPWCGHCKKMKPGYQEAATKVKELGLGGLMAALDGTKETKVMENFTISGFPTVKFFKDGVEMYEVKARSSDQFVEFMKNPQEPVEEEEVKDHSWEAEASNVVFLGDGDFTSFVKKKKHSIVIFYAPWCTHCKSTKPHFMMAAEAFIADNKRSFVAVDCSVHTEVCKEYGVKGYPTIISFTYGRFPKPYSGQREAKDFISFMKGIDFPIQKPPRATHLHWDDLENHQVITILSNKLFDTFIASHAFVVVAFYGPTCSHCHAMRKDFIEAAMQLQDDKADVKFAAVDAMTESKLRERFNLNSLPNIKAFRNGIQLIDFDDIARSKKNFLSYVSNPPEEVKPFSTYKPQEAVIFIDSTSLFDTALTQQTTLFVFFHDPSCPKCLRGREAFWSSVSKVTALGGKLGVVDCVQQRDLCKREAVVEVPSYKLYSHGKFHSKFESSASVKAFEEFLSHSLVKVKVEL